MNNQTKNREPTSIAFHLREYESLRKEIEGYIRESRILERYALIGTWVVWVWLATHYYSETPVNIPKITWWIPCLFVFLSGFRAWALLQGIFRVSKYIYRIEQAFSYSETVTGWETFLKNEKSLPVITISAVFFWILLLAVTIIVPYFLLK